MEINVLLFYKFVKIGDAKNFADEHLRMCNEIGVLGRILVAGEGINGSVCGTKEQVESYKKRLKQDSRFGDIFFKEEKCKSAPFTKMRVLVKDSVINIGSDVDMSKKAGYISPEELVRLYNGKEEFLILDTRNDYEWKVGKFKGARVLPIKTFRQFPEVLERELADKKDSMIVTYCTGGIRCEKASALMKSKGFKKVYQLKDGIINFCQQFPNSFWEGKCFVFDKRLMNNTNSSKIITNCELCSGKCDLYRNCKNHSCDRLVVMCVECERKMNACCSLACLREFKKHCQIKAFTKQGRRVKLL